MSGASYRGIRYHLWNPYTPLEAYLKYLGIGPSVITSGEGPYVYNRRGKRYISGNSSIWNVAVGLGREELIQAAELQLRELAFHGCWYTAHPRAIELAARLVEITGGHFQWVYLGANGTEAIETALKMARQYHRQSQEPADRGRHKIISLRGSYHGFSLGAVSTSGLEHDADKYGPLVPGFRQIGPPYCYRCPYNQNSYPECGLLCADALEEKIIAEGPETVAAFIFEPVMGDFGMVGPPDEYYRRVGEICQANGLLLIADEVTTGFGRTGKLFASQDWPIRPDILCLGKAITSGYQPLSATLATEAVFDRFRGEGNYFTHGSTHSGHPVGAAVALAAIDIIIDERLPDNAARIGAFFKERLTALMDRHEIIGDVRVHGLMLALELVGDRETKQPLDDTTVFDLGRDAVMRGLLLSIHKNQLRLLPPLIIDQALAEEIVEILDKALTTSVRAGIGRKARLLKELIASRRFI